MEIDGERTEVATGSSVYVPSGVQHRFVDIIETLELLVVFAPAESDPPAPPANRTLEGDRPSGM